MALYSLMELKAITKQKGLIYADLLKASGVPEGTIRNIFSGRIPNSGYDTVCAIYRALGLDNDDTQASTPDIVRVYNALSDCGEACKKWVKNDKKGGGHFVYPPGHFVYPPLHPLYDSIAIPLYLPIRIISIILFY